MKNIILFIFVLLIQSQLIGQNALHFDGVNDRINCGNHSSVQISGTQITLEAWIKPSSFGPNVWSNNIIDKESWSPQQGYMLRCGSSGKVNFNLGSNNAWNELTTSTTVLTTNTWYHVAGTYDGSYMRIYINGVCTDSISKNISFNDATANNLTIGDNSQVGRNFAGSIDEVRIWNIARTKAQIQAGMNNEYCGGISGLRAYFKFNQGIASGNNTSISSAINSAVVGINGSLSGFSLNGGSSNFITGQSLSPAAGGSTDSVYATICSGNSYPFNGQQLTTGGTYNATLSNSTGCDSIVTLFLTVNTSVSNFVYDTICQGGSYTFGNQTLTSAGVYSHAFTAANGCDSNVTLTLAIRNVNTNVSVHSGYLAADLGGAQYQWIRCPGLDTIGLGLSQGQTFYPPSNGSYAVIIQDNSCIDTSDCHLVTGVGISEAQTESPIQLYPNPSTGNFHIDVQNPDGAALILLDVFGREIFQTHISNSYNLNLSSQSKGIYILKIQLHQKEYLYKLILR